MRDRYTLTERVDQGGMAEVFRGVAQSIHGFKKSVAIKRILPSLTKNKKFVAMFLDEAKLSLFLQHANIVQVFDIGMADEAYFLVMEYVDGCNLKALLDRLKQRGRRLPVPQAIYIMLECCKALNYAHNAENPETSEPLHIVHRDISPPNILLSKNGEIKLVDFGLAKANSQIESTDPGVVKGKFSYLSPEAASGLDVDHRADLFAVGILLWEMFTGRRLFYGDTDYQTVELVRQARIPSIAALNPEIEPELEAIVRKSLARDPDDRYQTAADMSDALAQYLFSRRMKVTARDLTNLVREVQAEQVRKRSLAPKQESLLDALIQEEVAKITSLVEEETEDSREQEQQRFAAGSASLDPSAFVDTSSWASDFGLQEAPANAAREEVAAGNGAPPPPAPAAAPPRREAPPPAPAKEAEIESLQQMLEPDRTGLHAMGKAGSRGVVIALVIALLLAGAIGTSLFVFKDRLFGEPATATPAAPQ
jgi:serine/threonine-protein kinase